MVYWLYYKVYGGGKNYDFIVLEYLVWCFLKIVFLELGNLNM